MSLSEKIQTKYGVVRGTTRTTDEGKKYAAFFSIPYAKQPIGELRFRDPEPLEPWTDDLDATEENAGAYQVAIFNPKLLGTKSVTGTDSCLILNVFSTNTAGKLPVLVWIHGGGFAVGSSSTMFYGPDYLVEKDILVVTINYRLGVVGFLSFKDESLGVFGNAGLKDQSMALKWVKENISDFGGDPNNITLAGESAGGASVHYHLISPMSEGLFNRAIVQSGSVWNTWAQMPADESYEYDLARKLGWNGEGGDKEVYDVIATTEIHKLLMTAVELQEGLDQSKRLFGSACITLFLPKVEPYKGKLCFLPKSTVELGREAWGRNIDVIIGGMKDEGLLFENEYDECAPMLKNDFKLLIPNELRRTLNVHEQTAAASILKNIYFWKKDIDFKFKSKFVEIIGDLTFWHGFHRNLLQRFFKGGAGKTYLYILANNIDPENEFYKLIRLAIKVNHSNGSAHGEDIMLTWKSSLSNRIGPNSFVYPVFVKFLGIYTSFIKTGNPNNTDLGVKWKTIGEKRSEEEMFNCLKFSDGGVVDLLPSPFEEKLLVWDSIYDPHDLI